MLRLIGQLIRCHLRRRARLGLEHAEQVETCRRLHLLELLHGHYDSQRPALALDDEAILS